MVSITRTTVYISIFNNMKISPFTVLAFSVVLRLATSFTKEDHEIFRLRDELETTEGKEVTFYGTK